MVTDALTHIPDCLAYMQRISDPQIFRFCAIPQVMAIATLAVCYNNKDVFRKVCKIRKGLSAKMMLETNDMTSVLTLFRQHAKSMYDQIPVKDPNYKKTKEILEQTLKQIVVPINRSVLRVYSIIAWILLIISAVYLLYRVRQRSIETELVGSAPVRPSFDFLVATVLVLCIAYIFGFFGLAYV
jgi:farnesyl-diphosphate farnesyltransferase